MQARIEASWTSWRGRAVEPLIRDALARPVSGSRWSEVAMVGGWWNRANNPEVDLVGAARRPARSVTYVGSVKWLESTRLDGRDRLKLERDAASVPGVDDSTPLVAVSRAGFVRDLGLAATWGPEEIVDAFRTP